MHQKGKQFQFKQPMETNLLINFQGSLGRERDLKIYSLKNQNLPKDLVVKKDLIEPMKGFQKDLCLKTKFKG